MSGAHSIAPALDGNEARLTTLCPVVDVNDPTVELCFVFLQRYQGMFMRVVVNQIEIP